MTHRTRELLRILALVAALFVVVVCVVEGFLTHARNKGVPRQGDCYETPSAADVGRTWVPPVHAHGGLYACGLYACGLYSRPALPDVIRCYELNRGCTK